MLLRPFQSLDRPHLISLIDRVYREYGDSICLERADRDLLDITHHYLQRGGAFVVLADEHQVLGSHAFLPLDETRCTFRRLYLDASLRGQDWGRRLMAWAVDGALAIGLRRVEFWSDTRFERAHQFFARCGFQRDGRTREMTDGHLPYHEYFFSADLEGVRRQLGGAARTGEEDSRSLLT